MDHQLVNALFDEAFPLPAAEREALLRTRCTDEAVIRRVLGLLAAADAAPETLAPPALDPSEFLPVVPGFRIIRLISEGGMGAVYEAEEHELGRRRRVALKLILPELLVCPEARERFRREAMTAARLDHPAIVPVYRYSELGGPQFIAMKYIDGRTFDEHCRTLFTEAATPENGRAAGRDAEVFRTIAAGLQRVAEALHHAHGLGVVHRDVKPSNILVDRDGRTFLSDFGIAKAADEPGLTSAPHAPLTVDYASPEQVHRVQAQAALDAAAEIDGRSDVFSLGVILYEALTGVHPFRRADPDQTRSAICSFDPPLASGRRARLPRRLATIVRIAIEKDRRFRYPTAAHLATDLGQWLRGEPIFGRDVGLWRRLHRWAHRRRRSAAAIGVAALAVAAIGLSGSLVAQRRAQTSEVRVRAPGLPAGSLTLAVSRVDPSSLELGAPEEKGTLPVRFRAPPGAYRLTAAGPDGSRVETAMVVLPHDPTLDVVLTAPQRPVRHEDGMVRIAGGELEFGVAGRQGFLKPRRVHVAPFLIDAAEVSNRDYLEFVQASRRPPPAFWGEMRAEPRADGRFDADFADRPVVDVSWDDAVAFARWRGKRLPTVFEWEFAMRDGGRRPQPWGDGPAPELPAVPCEDMLRAGISDRAFHRAAYARYTSPVRSLPALASPEGIFHGSSNVREMVETVSMLPTAVRLIKGAGWHQLPQVTTPAEMLTLPLVSVGPDGVRIWDSSMTVGFRCAKSAD